VSERQKQCPRCRELRQKVAALELVVAQQAELIRELQARLGLNSRNSSKPPSSDPPQAKRPRRSKGKGRKRGGQPGHEGKTRAWFPLDDVDKFVDVRPSHCGCCARPLGPEAYGLLDPWRHQVVDLPPVSAFVTEYLMHGAVCGACGERTLASLPEGVMPWAVGPRLQAVLSTLSGRFRLSRREVLEAAEALFGPKARLSLGTLVALEERTRLALTAAYEEAARGVQEASIVHPDETSYYEGTHKSWLWVAATPEVAYYRIDPQRGRAAFHRLLPDFRGSIVVDRWNAYVRHPQDQRQLCWSHLKRNFQELVDRGSPATRVGRPGLRAADAIFGAWKRHQEGRLTLPGLRRRLAPQKRKLERALKRGLKNQDRKARAMAKDLGPQYACLWTFTKTDGMAPHNNLAERMIRPAVLWRKSSFGTQSLRGSRFAECMLTVSQTLRLQGWSVLDFVERSIRAARCGKPAPSLLSP
jgi:transposase